MIQKELVTYIIANGIFLSNDIVKNSTNIYSENDITHAFLISIDRYKICNKYTPGIFISYDLSPIIINDCGPICPHENDSHLKINNIDNTLTIPKHNNDINNNIYIKIQQKILFNQDLSTLWFIDMNKMGGKIIKVPECVDFTNKKRCMNSLHCKQKHETYQNEQYKNLFNNNNEKKSETFEIDNYINDLILKEDACEKRKSFNTSPKLSIKNLSKKSRKNKQL
jgi:hypothetical protein